MYCHTSKINQESITEDEKKCSVKSELLPKSWTTEDLLEMVGTNGWRNYMVICLSLSCTCIYLLNMFVINFNYGNN